MIPTHDPDLVSINVAAGELGLQQRVVARWVDQGRISHSTNGKHRVVSLAETRRAMVARNDKLTARIAERGPVTPDGLATVMVKPTRAQHEGWKRAAARAGLPTSKWLIAAAEAAVAAQSITE